MKRVICIFFGVILLSGCSRTGKEDAYSRTAALMDTFVQVKVAAPGRDRAELAKAADRALGRARELEKKFSIFDPESEVNALNIAGVRTTSPELFDLVMKASKAGRITDGEFDITVAPVLKADGFYGNMPAEIRDRIPEGFSGVGWKNVTLDPAGRSITLHNGAWIDLSGIAKGYIVDQMSAFLRNEGIEVFLINAGGDIYCGTGKKSGDWKIGVRRPGALNIAVTLSIRNMAVATSGDYENVIVDGNTGKIVSHIIDPSVDEARREIPSSVTVIASTCTEADALATGMMAMGREKAIALADTMDGVSIIAIECPGGQEKVSFSGGAAEYLAER